MIVTEYLSVYRKCLSKIYEIYQYPYKVLWLIIHHIRSCREDFNNTPITSLRLTKKWLVKNKVQLKLQIKNSRATYMVSISDVINDNDFILSCEKSSLIEIGYLARIEEHTRMLNIDTVFQEKPSILRVITDKLKSGKKINDAINPEKFTYSFLFIETEIILFIAFTRHMFRIPFEDLILDSSLLNNIYPPDLLKIGYELCAKDIHENNHPRYCL